MPVIIFKESKAFRTNKKISPKDREDDIRIFFTKILAENTKAKKRGVKKNKICCQFA